MATSHLRLVRDVRKCGGTLSTLFAETILRCYAVYPSFKPDCSKARYEYVGRGFWRPASGVWPKMVRRHVPRDPSKARLRRLGSNRGRLSVGLDFSMSTFGCEAVTRCVLLSFSPGEFSRNGENGLRNGRQKWYFGKVPPRLGGAQCHSGRLGTLQPHTGQACVTPWASHCKRSAGQ